MSFAIDSLLLDLLLNPSPHHAKRSVRQALVIGVILAFSWFGPLPASCQANEDFREGMLPYESFHEGDIDHISMSNGNLFVHMPLVNTMPTRMG